MNIEIIKQDKNITWDDVTFPWIGKDPSDGHVVLFSKKGLGITLVPSKNKNQAEENPVGFIRDNFHMGCFNPMPKGTKISLEV